MASHITRRLFSTTTRRMADQSLKDESKRNPETMVRFPFFPSSSSHQLSPTSDNSTTTASAPNDGTGAQLETESIGYGKMEELTCEV